MLDPENFTDHLDTVKQDEAIAVFHEHALPTLTLSVIFQFLNGATTRL